MLLVAHLAHKSDLLSELLQNAQSLARLRVDQLGRHVELRDRRAVQLQDARDIFGDRLCHHR
jgi:hypothetical protein